jgi:hypothetical protein
MTEEISEAAKSRAAQLEQQMHDRWGRDQTAARVGALTRVGLRLSEQDLANPQFLSMFDHASKEALLKVAADSEDRGERREADAEYARIRQKEREAWRASKGRSR